MFRLVILSIVLWVTGCDINIPAIDTNMDELAPWSNVPETASLQYVEKFSKPAMEPRFLAAAKFQTQQDLDRLIDYFELKPVDSIKSVWPSSFQPAEFSRSDSLEMLSKVVPMHGSSSTVIVTNLWIDHENKILVIEKSWEL
jgi:hypothetical protein